MSNLSLNLAIVLQGPETEETRFARVKVPDSLSRFVPLPADLHPKSDRPVVWAGVSLEQIIADNLNALFPGMTIQEHHATSIAGSKLSLRLKIRSVPDS